MSQPQQIEVQEAENLGPMGEPRNDVQGKSQGQLVRQRFFGNTGAVVSLIVLLFIVLLAITSIGIDPSRAGGSGILTRREPLSMAAVPHCHFCRRAWAIIPSARTTWAVTCSP